jgi:PPM family protein phosphatase
VDYAGRQILGSRERQEDAFVFEPIEKRGYRSGFLIGALADGMGGLLSGDRAANTTVDTFIEYMKGPSEGEISLQMVRGLQAANKELFEIYEESDLSGSTLVGFCINENILYWVSVGDSLLFLYREATLIRLNEDHSAGAFFDRAVQAGTITHSDALSHPRRNALLSYIGGEVIESIDCNREGYPLKTKDIIIAASDGINSIVENGTLESCLKKNSNLSASTICEEILKSVESQKDPDQDNATVMIVKA